MSKQTFCLEIEFEAGYNDQFKTDLIIDSISLLHLNAFWKKFKSHPDKLMEFYKWLNFSIFEGCSGFEDVAAQQIKKDEIIILAEMVKHLPQGTSEFILSLISKEPKIDALRKLDDKCLQAIIEQFHPPVLKKVRLKEVDSGKPTQIYKLYNPDRYDLTCVIISNEGDDYHLIVITGQPEEPVKETLRSLQEAQKAFLDKFGDRKINKSVKPNWGKKED